MLHVLVLGKHDLRINGPKFQHKELVLILEKVNLSTGIGY